MVLCLSACTSTPAPEGKPLPDMTFAHVLDIPVRASVVNIDNKYDPKTNPKDMSIDFPVTPDLAAQRYAEKRFEPDGSPGTFFFVIENSFVSHSVIEPEGTISKLTGFQNKDRYDVYLTLRLYRRDQDGKESKNAVLNFNRYITIPQRYSLSRKEQVKFQFIEYLVEDLDKALLNVIADRMDLFSNQTLQSLDDFRIESGNLAE
jgi:hypothetical protein